MTAVQNNIIKEELLQSIAAIAGDERLMRRLSRYAKRLAKEKEEAGAMSEEEFFARIDASRKEYEQGLVHAFDSVEELDSYIRSL